MKVRRRLRFRTLLCYERIILSDRLFPGLKAAASQDPAEELDQHDYQNRFPGESSRKNNEIGVLHKEYSDYAFVM